jgi:hypothetical protein
VTAIEVILLLQLAGAFLSNEKGSLGVEAPLLPTDNHLALQNKKVGKAVLSAVIFPRGANRIFRFQ